MPIETPSETPRKGSGTPFKPLPASSAARLMAEYPKSAPPGGRMGGTLSNGKQFSRDIPMRQVDMAGEAERLRKRDFFPKGGGFVDEGRSISRPRSRPSKPRPSTRSGGR